ncbi:MAG: bifunctional UDP-N-acetylglucosamine diphosphorylase/glucosamine-1-phosphate N-acetyltransferase GlmU [Oscillospiraceae bacterium]
MNKTCAVILAAGDGKRMNSNKPKAVCEVLFKPMISYVIDVCHDCEIDDICVVVGDNSEYIKEVLPKNAQTVLQSERKGTGHALMMAKEYIKNSQADDVIVLYADAPFMTKEVMENAFERHHQTDGDMTIITANLNNPFGYGRIIRDHGIFRGIVEEKDTTETQKQITEINSGTYIFKSKFVLQYLDKIKSNNAQGEYYLTDLASIGLLEGKLVVPFKAKNNDIVLGANTRKDLYSLNEIARKRVIEKHMEQGVNFASTDGVIIGNDVVIGRDTVIYPNVVIKGDCQIGENCTITTGSIIENSKIGDNTLVNSSQVFDSIVGSGVKIGPYSHLRPNSSLSDNVKVGNFVEIKNSNVGEKTSVAHLTYIGDTDMGSHVNVGCGCVMVNYDGFRKHRTTVEDDCFIGCNSNLVAPVTIKKGSYTAAGSTITKDVPENSLGVARAKQRNIEQWATSYNEKNAQYKKKK